MNQISAIRQQRLARVYRAVAIYFLAAALIWLPFIPPKRLVAAAVSKESVIQAINYERLRSGLTPLVEDPLLSQSARRKALDMVNRGYFAHYYATTTPWDFILAAGVTDWQHAGENLAKNYANSASLVAAWMNSPKHRANILSTDFTATGVATVKGISPTGEEVFLTVQFFTGA